MAYAAEREKYFPFFSLILLLKVMRGGRGTLWAGGGGAAKPISQQQAKGERESFLFPFFGSDLTGGTITLFCAGGTHHNRSKEFPRYMDGISHHSVGKEGSIQLWSEVEESSKMSKLGCRDRDDGISSFSEFFPSFPPCSTVRAGEHREEEEKSGKTSF